MSIELDEETVEMMNEIQAEVMVSPTPTKADVIRQAVKDLHLIVTEYYDRESSMQDRVDQKSTNGILTRMVEDNDKEDGDKVEVRT